MEKTGGLAVGAGIRCDGEFGERGGEPVPEIDVDPEFAVTAAEALDERVPGADHPGRAEPFEAAHGPQPARQPAVVGLDGVIRVLVHGVVCGGDQLVEHAWIDRCPVGGHLARSWGVLERPGEEPAGCREVPFLRGQDVDDLPELVHRPIQVDPPAGDLDVGLVDESPVIRGVPAGPGGVDEQRGEPLHPPIHRHVIHLHAAFGKEP